MKTQIVLDDRREYPEISDDLPADLPRPHWLKSGYEEPVWIIANDNPSSPKPDMKIRFSTLIHDPLRPGKICRLTDPEYAHLLDTARRQIYLLRTGKYAAITSAAAHLDIARAILTWIAWMIRNNIRRFSNLDEDDFDAYVESALYGPGYLLMMAPRLAEHIKKLREAGLEIPHVKKSNKKPYLNRRKLLEDAGIDPYKGRVDKTTSYELLKTAQEEGFYLSPEHLARLAEGAPQPEKVVNGMLFRALLPWEHQWRMRREIPGDCIEFEAFSDTTPDRMARELGRETGRTRTSPILQTMELIDRSLRWIIDYAPVLLDLRDTYSEIFPKRLNPRTRYRHMTKVLAKAAIPEGPGRPYPLNASIRETMAEGLGVGIAINAFIPAAAVVVIAAFTSRRHGEVKSIRAAGPHNADCISQDEHGLWLETYIEKTVQDWDKTPCSEVAAMAVEVLRRWSAPARALSGDVRLFQFKTFTSNAVVFPDLRRALDQFVSFLSLTPMPDGSQWKFTPHQLRRFFAILYFWHYQFRDLAALSYHLRHFDPEMTKIYITEPEAGAIFRHVNKEHTAIILTEAALGERNISGPYGERFKSVVQKLRSHYRRSLKVISSKLVRRTVERYVEKSGRRLKAMLWGWCACGPQPHQLSTAQCLKNNSLKTAGGPDFSQSSPVVCGGCPHHLTESFFEPFWRSELEFHERAADDPRNGPILREASRRHVEKLRCQCEKSFETSKPLEKLK